MGKSVAKKLAHREYKRPERRAMNEQARNAAMAQELADAHAELKVAQASGSRRQLQRARRRVDEAGYVLWEANKPLVYRFAGRFGDSEEWAQDGLVALWESIKSWDPDKGALTTWAFPRVKKAIIKEVAARDHNLKTHAFLARVAINGARETLRAKLGRDPTDEEVAAAADSAVSLVRHLRLSEVAGKPVSLNRPVDAEGTELGELAGPVTSSAEDEALGTAVPVTRLSDLPVDDLAELTANCSMFELWVGLRHTGADDGPDQEFAEMATQLGVSRERARKGFGRFVEKVAHIHAKADL